MLDSRLFGYFRIKVLRPLRMARHINEGTIATIEEGKAGSRLSDIQKSAWERAWLPLPVPDDWIDDSFQADKD